MIFTSPYPIISILFLYLSFVLVYGPWFMKNKKAYSLKTFIRYYDLFQIIANSLIAYKILKGGFSFSGLSTNCEPPSYKTDYASMQLVEGCHWMMYTKLFDLIETGIFVLRKKTRQISFLHLYHHVSTVTIGWILGRYYIDERTAFIPLMNCFVHIVMYTYYFLSTLGPNMQKIISQYKFILTTVQMVQFIIMLLFVWQMTSSSCDVAKIAAFVMFVEKVDSRTKLWPLVGTTFAVPTIILIYLLAIYLGTKYMSNRPAYSLKTFIYFYNIFQIIANSVIVYMYIDGGWYKDIFIYCIPITYSTDPASMKIVNAFWWTMIIKLFDFVETGIFVLRKKYRQVSFFHVYHHITTALISWLAIRYYAGGMVYFFPVVNCSIHVIMYTYYFLSSLGPEMQKLILPYKPILTITQMIQLMILMSHIIRALLPSCDMPKFPSNTLFSDPRAKDWVLFNPWIVIFVLFSYLYFVLVCGPRFMKNRQPYSLKTFIRYYNIFQILANSFIVYKLIKGGWFTTISIYCEPVVYGTDPDSMQIFCACWWAYLTKFVDLMETGIFVLRKKHRQISFLHLYHHISTVLISWIFGKYYAAGMGTFPPLVNCSVHAIMYSYYLLSTCGPSIRKVIHPYKFLLTITQMVQFVILICHCLQSLSPNCDIDNTPGIIMITNLWIFGKHYTIDMATFIPLVNCSVHVVMYTCYLLSTCSPSIQKVIHPYKFLLTIIQMIHELRIRFIVYKLIKGGWFTTISIYCEPIVYGTDPDSMQIFYACWWAYLTKFVDLMETGIFVLRKKHRQISFLHLYHHISTVLICWIFGKYYAAGMASFLPLVNCSVHVVMYTYYLLSTFGPSIRKVIHPYKFLLTITQMVQFVILICHCLQTLSPNCDIDKTPGVVMIINLLINFYLFYDFYKKTYVVKQMKQTNSFIVYKLIKSGWFTTISIYCKPAVYGTDPDSMQIFYACWWAYLTKFIDLMETGLFVLQKKHRQISFLHLYHHISTVLISWIFGKCYAAGMGTFPPLVNCSVHVVMYTYYLLSTFGPSIRKVIHPYKFLLTIIQMEKLYGQTKEVENTLFSDPRAKDWVLFNPWIVIFILFSYLYFVLVCGPRFMKNRQPYSLKTFIRYYNIFQILANSFIVYKLIKGGWFTTISIYCEPIVYGTDPDSMQIFYACWWAYLTKFVDLMETGIFVLRKKHRQISFLHLYHHISTVLICWIFGKYYAAGMASFLPLVNCSVHVVMYTYYLLSTCGPSIRKVIHPYKFLLTITQMVQFVILICHCLQTLSPNCDIDKTPGVSGWFTTISIYCEPIVYGTDPDSMQIFYACWWAYLTKFIDLMETGLFVLRKKHRQISFLHLYHNVPTVLIAWIFEKHYGGEMATFIPLTNCNVHIYYLKTNLFSDPRFEGYVLFYSWVVVSVIFLYLYFVLVSGPRFMKNRPPYSLKTFIRSYNVFQIAMNCFVVHKFIKGGWFTRISIFCEPAVFGTDPASMELFYAGYWTYFTKFIDLIETGIFVLRKKNRQISSLHLYHHVSTILISWIFVKHYTIEMATFIPLVNCSVHVVMYTYYLLSTFGPSIRKVIHPYKFLLTIIQMDDERVDNIVQFVILICHCLQSLSPNCDIDNTPGVIMITNLLINFYLFYDFYKKTYVVQQMKQSFSVLQHVYFFSLMLVDDMKNRLLK
ncbi:elongation of very long chain fatty acids protein 4-like [Vespula squamosa]|uniref:Elongation of very long chain fatty acids protein n=1 Tax=Vespula squamosa TaxID=30214 RepID=A0ABD2C7E3_VESSQ